VTPRKKMLSEDKKNVPDQGAVEAAMWALPLWLPSELCDGYIPALAEKYIYMGVDRLCASKPCTKREVESQLSRIKAQSESLLTSLMQLQEPSVDALNSCRSTISPTIGELKRSLQWLNKAASLARPSSTAKTRKGPDRKSHALEVAKAAACDFHSLTGKAPSFSKIIRFPGFLGEIFKALDMRGDSIEHFAKEASHWWHNERSNEVMESLRETMLKPISVSEEGFIFSKTSGGRRSN
jgi:hypothetical protein